MGARSGFNRERSHVDQAKFTLIAITISPMERVTVSCIATNYHVSRREQREGKPSDGSLLSIRTSSNEADFSRHTGGWLNRGRLKSVQDSNANWRHSRNAGDARLLRSKFTRRAG
jgi:hypothetical protein